MEFPQGFYWLDLPFEKMLRDKFQIISQWGLNPIPYDLYRNF